MAGRDGGRSLGAQRFAAVGTTRAVAAELDRSAGTIADWRSGRRRPGPEMMATIERRYGIPASDWHASSRVAGRSTRPEEEPTAPVEPLLSDVAEGDLAAGADAVAELHEVIRTDLERLRGPDGEQLALGARSEVIRRLVGAQAALARSTSGGALTCEQILSSTAWEQIVNLLRDAIGVLPAGVGAVDAVVRAIASDGAIADVDRDQLRRAIAAGLGGELAHRARRACPDCSWRAAADRLTRRDPAEHAARIGPLTEEQIVEHPAFARLMARVTGALADHPLALREVSVALERTAETPAAPRIDR